ncbi:MAG: hypothetical protein ABW199_08950 [Caulobacterales bacterium]
MDIIATALIHKALEGLYQRHLYTSQNIANANSPGYAPVRVTFEESLRAAAANGVAAIEDVEPQIQSIAHTALSGAPGDTTEAGAEGLRLDLELAEASQTAMRYRALLDVLSRQMALERAVVSQGR